MTIPNQNVCTPGAIARISLAIAFVCCPAIRAADTIQPINLRLGLWESTSTSEVTGQIPIPQEARKEMAKMKEAMAKMPPEQRAKMEALMNVTTPEAVMKALTSPEARTPTVHRACVKKEDRDQLSKLGDIGESCTRTLLSSSGSKLEMRVQCAEGQGMKQTGSFRLEVVNPENVKGSMQMTATDGTHTMNMNSSFSAKWIGPVCESK
jgi:hypothetical protein